MSNYIPMVVEKEGQHERSYDIFSRLLKDRIVMLQGPVMEGTGAVITAQFLFLDEQGPGDIEFFINSPGGLVTEGMAIYDVMNYIRAPVQTIVMGQAASMGSLLACAGEPGKRWILPHARHMVHQPSAGFRGQATDIQIHAAETQRVKDELNAAYVKHTGRSIKEIEAALDRDNFMNAKESIEFGLADIIASSRQE